MKGIDLSITFEREADGRWIADIEAMPGVMAYGQTMAEAAGKVATLAVEVQAAIETMEGM